MLRGFISSFDSRKGIGTVEADSGIEYFFHCAEIADGSREAEIGASVIFVPRPGSLGRWEATGIEPV